MCGRVTLTVPAIEAVAEALGAELDPTDAAAYEPRANVAPSERHWMLRRSNAGRRRLERAAWGFTVPAATATQRLMFNARSETAERLGLFRDAWQRRRCVVPTDGFYEWSGPRGDRRPTWFRAPDEGLLLMAGLFDERADGTRFTILTTRSSGLVAPLHDRMPVVLRPDQVEAWLEAPDPALMEPAPPEALVARPASPSVNSTRPRRTAADPSGRSDQASRSEARPATGRAKQLSLFGDG